MPSRIETRTLTDLQYHMEMQAYHAAEVRRLRQEQSVLSALKAAEVPEETIGTVRERFEQREVPEPPERERPVAADTIDAGGKR